MSLLGAMQGGTAIRSAAAITSTTGVITMSTYDTSETYHVHLRTLAGDGVVFIDTDTENGDGGMTMAAPTVTGEGSLWTGTFVGGADIPCRCASGATATLHITLHKIIR